MSKRRNGEGSVFQRASDGAWIAQASVRTEDGKRRYVSRSAPTREAAERLLLDLPTHVRTTPERFESFVVKGRGCWEWSGGRAHGGYGQFSTEGGVRIAAHRFAWQLANGPIPDGLQVLHRCDNPPCVRPDHLFLGTIADNVHDMVAKGRARGGRGGWPTVTELVTRLRASVDQ